MKYNFNLNLGNVVGAVINAVPGLESKVDLKNLSDIKMEVSAEYTITEAVTMIAEVKKLMVEMPSIIASMIVDIHDVSEIVEEIQDYESKKGEIKRQMHEAKEKKKKESKEVDSKDLEDPKRSESILDIIAATVEAMKSEPSGKCSCGCESESTEIAPGLKIIKIRR